MNPALRRTSAHVFVDDLGAPALSPDDQHHLARVLRLRPGETVSASDGRGGWRPCEFDGTGLSATGDIVSVAPGEPPITIGFAVPKGDRGEWIVQKLTELGVDRIVLLEADRSVVRWDETRAARHLTRLTTIAREAAMQARRVHLPTLAGPLSIGRACVGPVAVAEPGGDQLTLQTSAVLIGPEGGWSERELAQVEMHVTLGKTILRVETAAVAAAVRLIALRDEPATT